MLTTVSSDYGYQLMVVLEVKILAVATSSLQKSKSDFFSIFELPLTHLWILMTFIRNSFAAWIFLHPCHKSKLFSWFLRFSLVSLKPTCKVSAFVRT